MKILYGINTVGQGHINRARTIINQLRAEGHQIDCLFGGPEPPKYAYSLGDRWLRTEGYVMRGNHNGVNPAMTFWYNLKRGPIFFRAMNDIRRLILKENYDAILNDFEFISSVAGGLSRKPVIVVDHQHALIFPGVVRPPGHLFDTFACSFTIRFSAPHYAHVISLDFVNHPIIGDRITLFPLIKKPELSKYEVTVDDHYIVYTSVIAPRKIYKVLSQFPKEKFLVYGFNKKQQKDNVILKPTSRENFLRDLASSKGIISHAGFSLAWETLLLGKPFLVIPVPHHYEQFMNAKRLSRLGVANSCSDLTKEAVQNFIDGAEAQNFQLRNHINIVEPEALTKRIYEEIERGFRLYIYIWK